MFCNWFGSHSDLLAHKNVFRPIQIFFFLSLSLSFLLILFPIRSMCRSKTKNSGNQISIFCCSCRYLWIRLSHFPNWDSLAAIQSVREETETPASRLQAPSVAKRHTRVAPCAWRYKSRMRVNLSIFHMHCGIISIFFFPRYTIAELTWRNSKRSAGRWKNGNAADYQSVLPTDKQLIYIFNRFRAIYTHIRPLRNIKPNSTRKPPCGGAINRQKRKFFLLSFFLSFFLSGFSGKFLNDADNLITHGRALKSDCKLLFWSLLQSCNNCINATLRRVRTNIFNF